MKESADFLKTSQELDVVLENLSEKAVLCRLSQSVWSGNKNGSISLMLMKGLIFFSFNRIPSGNAAGNAA